MDQDLFNAADRHAEQIAEVLDRVLPSPDFQQLREALAALGKALGGGTRSRCFPKTQILDRPPRPRIPYSES